MAKGRGNNRKKESRRARSRGGATQVLTLPASQAPAAPRRGVEATRGSVSGAYKSWVTEYGRRQVQSVQAQFEQQSMDRVPPDLFLLAPLTTRTVETPKDKTVAVQMGLPLVATRAGGITIAPDRLGVAVLLLPETDTGGALGMLGLGQTPDLPPPELLFAAQLPAESLRGTRAADAVAWYLARAVEAGDVALNPQALANAASEALALLRPNVAPREAPRLDPAALDGYEGYGTDADEEPVPLDISAPPARGGLPGLPSGSFLQDMGAPLAPLLADLRDYVIGLWPYEYFGLEALTAHPTAGAGERSAALAALADLVRRLDDYLARTTETLEGALAAEGQPPAWIAEETAPLREARQSLRATHTAQEMLPRLGPILFDLEIPPEDYTPPGWDGDDVDDDAEEEME